MGFFHDGQGHLSMVRLLAFLCCLFGSGIAVGGLIVGMPEAVVSGSVLAAVGVGGKTLQKKYEEER